MGDSPSLYFLEDTTECAACLCCVSLCEDSYVVYVSCGHCLSFFNALLCEIGETCCVPILIAYSCDVKPSTAILVCLFLRKLAIHLTVFSSNYSSLPSVVDQWWVRNVVESARDIEQQEARYLAVAFVPCLVDSACDGMQCVFSRAHPPAAHVCVGQHVLCFN